MLTQLLLDLDAYDLWGSVSLPKRHTVDEIAKVYQAVAAGRGVFINPALTEPFGLTLLEAAACGLPLVATENGGPVDIISNCRNGILVDPLDADAIAQALLELLTDDERWHEASRNGLEGVRRHYTWEAHARRYVEKVGTLIGQPRRELVAWPVGQAARYRDRALFTDIDQTLLGNDDKINVAIHNHKIVNQFSAKGFQQFANRLSTICRFVQNSFYAFLGYPSIRNPKHFHTSLLNG